MRHSRTKTGQRIALTALLGWMLASVPVQVDGITELFFSEYIEGTSNNKALEIYNGTGSAINLATAGYSVQMFFNGSASAGLTINLTGTVAPGDVYVIAQSSANATILAQADQTNGAGWFNGDDAVVLRKGTTVIDVIGQIGFDPGSEWGSDQTSTADNTLRRLPTVCGGDTNGSDAFDPSVQWEGLATDTFGGLGSHTANCTATDSAPSVTEVLPANGATGVDPTANVTVTFSEQVKVTDGWFSLSCSVSGPKAADVSGGPTTFALNPTTDFVDGDACTLTVQATNVTDQDTNDPPDNMAADFVSSFSVSDPCTASFTPIYQIQGSGASTPLLGQVVTTRGVVVGDYEGASPALRGFYLQDPAGDGDAATSDGLFVFNANRNDANLGDLVVVTGTATEFQGQTQVSASSVNVCQAGTGTVTPTDVTFPVPSDDFLERYEGMLVRLPQTMYVTEHFQLGRFGQVVLSANGRLQQPTNVVAPGADALALQAQNDLNRIILDDASQAQNPDPIVFARGGAQLSASNTLRGGDTATGIVGVMTYTWAGNSASGNAFRVRPVNALGGYVNFEPWNPRPTGPPVVGGNLRVAGANLLNYFNTFDGLPDNVDNCSFGVGGAPADCRGADTQAEFDRQVAKTVAALLKVDADVLGLVELENDGYGADSAIQHLVDQLNAASAPGTYAFVDVDAATSQTNALGTDAIKVGVLYKPAKVTPVGQTAALNSAAFVNGGDGSARNRPSLAQAFETPTRDRFVLVVNHLKSKGSACDLPAQEDGQGNCNAVRLNAATQLATWLANDPTGTGAPALLVGDFNAYTKEDPIALLTQPAGAGFVNLVEQFLGPSAYSYVFDGQWGSLDHALVSPALLPRVTGVGVYHINADEPSALDYNTDFKTANLQNVLYAADEFRIADHDPLVVGLDFTYDFTGFFPPVANSPAVNARKAGSAVPVKFSLGGDQGLAILAAGSPVSVPVDCATGQAAPGSPTANPGNSGLSYDPSTDQYTYVWKTEKAWAGTCRQLSVTLVDGTTHTAFFSFR